MTRVSVNGRTLVVVGANPLIALGVATLLHEADLPGVGSIVVPEGSRRRTPGETHSTRATSAKTTEASITVLLDDADSGFGVSLRMVRRGHPIVLVTAASQLPNELSEALRKGVMWLVAPAHGFSAVREAVVAVMNGVPGWSVTQLLDALSVSQSSVEGSLPQVTPRELQLLNLMRTGAGNKSIAAEIDVTTKTVEALQRVLYRKLGVRNRHQAVQRWTESTASG